MKFWPNRAPHPRRTQNPQILSSGGVFLEPHPPPPLLPRDIYLKPLLFLLSSQHSPPSARLFSRLPTLAQIQSTVRPQSGRTSPLAQIQFTAAAIDAEEEVGRSAVGDRGGGGGQEGGRRHRDLPSGRGGRLRDPEPGGGRALSCRSVMFVATTTCWLHEGYVCIFELIKGARKRTMMIHVIRRVDNGRKPCDEMPAKG